MASEEFYNPSTSQNRIHRLNLIDLNDPPPENMYDNFGYDITEENGNAFEVYDPFVGQCFESEQEAYTFYEKYAKRNGFSVRKGRFTQRDGVIVRRDFFCHCEGFPEKKFVDPTKNQRNRESSRCGCKALMRIVLKKSFDIFPEQWHVTHFVSEHNHKLISSSLVRFLPAYRTISDDDKKQMLLFKEAGLSVRQIIRVMELEKEVRHGYLPFLKKDIHNFFQKIRQNGAKDDANNLLEHFKLAKFENSRFQYDYTVDDQNRLENIFWSPGYCFDWYQEYGDAIAFDTTYKVDYYDMPLGIFVGIDNHGRTILFGCALLRNETVDTFRWLMKTFVTLMKKSPKTIITDQDPWMTKAIAIEMPLTKHAFCIWHITSKFSGWFTSTLREKYMDWCAEFYKLYKLDNIEEFEHEWSISIEKFNLKDNKHVIGLYEIKKFWVPAYLRGSFFGGMVTTGRSESINSFIKRFTSSRSCLIDLIKQVNLAIEDIEQTQLHHTMLDTYRGSSLRTLSPLENQVYQVFTKFAFKNFQVQFEMATQYMMYEESQTMFIVYHYGKPHSQRHKVFWDGVVTNCSCKNFEFWGIICRHVLTVFLHKDCFKIPDRYLPLRWCSDEFKKVGGATISSAITRVEGEPNFEVSSIGATSLTRRINVECPPHSITKGRPKSKREKGGKELAKQIRSCSFCKRTGHNITTCPEKENFNTNQVSSDFANKRKKIAQEDYGSLNPVFSLKF